MSSENDGASTIAVMRQGDGQTARGELRAGDGNLIATIEVRLETDSAASLACLEALLHVDDLLCGRRDP